LSACTAALLAGPAWADVKWKFEFPTVSCTSTSCYGNTKNASTVSGSFTYGSTPGTGSVTASAWANSVGSTNTAIESAYLVAWGSNGLGVQNRDGETMPGNPGGSGVDLVEGSAPEHGMDNNQRYEAMLFSFNAATKLTGVEIGWPPAGSYDSDIFVMAYTGGLATPPLAGLSFSSLLSNGWTLVGNYADLVPGSVASVNTGAQTGGTVYTTNNWLIGTYSGLGTGCQDGRSGGFNDGCSGYNDYVKLLSVYGDRTKQVPEPGALLLLGVAFAGIWATRRRRQTA
jgi:hypothetical protein